MRSTKNLVFPRPFLYLFLGFSLILLPRVFATPISYDYSESILGDGTLSCRAEINTRDFQAGDDIIVRLSAHASSQELRSLLEKSSGLYLVLQAEKLFDENGTYHQAGNNYATASLTVSGLAIENFDPFFEYAENNPRESVGAINPGDTVFCRQIFIPKDELIFEDSTVKAKFFLQDKIGLNMPAGYYRFNVRILAKHGNDYHRVNYLPLFATPKPKFSDWELAIMARKTSALPIIKIGDPKPPKMIWSLFSTCYSQGTQGIIAEEDKNNFQFNSRHIIPDKFIISPNPDQSPKISLTIQPDFPSMFAKNMVKGEQAEKWDFQTPIPLNYASGEMSVLITRPDRTVIDLGTAKFARATATGAAPDKEIFKYNFDQYGKYQIIMRGWIEDIWGTRYQGGGTYELYVAQRLSFCSNAKPGMPFEAGNEYPLTVIVEPPCPAKINLAAVLYRDADPKNTKNYSIFGQANKFGYFCPTPEEKIIFDSPGEYLCQLNAEYLDSQGRLWLGSSRSASVVAEKDSLLTVFGREPWAHNMAHLDKRGTISYEGRFSDSLSNTPEFNSYTVSTMFPFPYYSGDILFIANTCRGDNGISPQLTFCAPPNIVENASPPLSPEKQVYAYMSAVRPGSSARFLIAQKPETLWDSYWQTGANFGGEQINHSANGDLPQDFCEFFGGIAFHDFKNNTHLYGIYASMAVIIPKGSFNNRISAPLQEPLLRLNETDYYLFETGAPYPGMVLETGDHLQAESLVLPPLENIVCEKAILSPSGKNHIFRGATNKIGYTKLNSSAEDKIILSEPGIYKVEAQCRYAKHTGSTLGSDQGNYFFYVLDKNADRPDFFLDLPEFFKIKHDQPLIISGEIDPSLKNPRVTYTITLPGMIAEQGEIKPENRRFAYRFSARDLAMKFPNYDIVAWEDPTIERMADTVTFTFFLSGEDADGKMFYNAKRFILRANQGMVIK